MDIVGFSITKDRRQIAGDALTVDRHQSHAPVHAIRILDNDAVGCVAEAAQ